MFNVKVVSSNLAKLNAAHVWRIVFHVLIQNFAISARLDFCIILKRGTASKSTRFYVTQQPLFYRQTNASNAQSLHINPIMFAINVLYKIADTV